MRFRLVSLVPAIATAIALSAFAAMAERAIISTTGQVWSETAMPSGSRLVRADQTITLTDTCAARIDGRGMGTWNWTAQGTRVTVGTYSVSFADVPLISMTRCAG